MLVLVWAALVVAAPARAHFMRLSRDVAVDPRDLSHLALRYEGADQGLLSSDDGGVPGPGPVRRVPRQSRDGWCSPVFYPAAPVCAACGWCSIGAESCALADAGPSERAPDAAVAPLGADAGDARRASSTAPSSSGRPATSEARPLRHFGRGHTTACSCRAPGHSARASGRGWTSWGLVLLALLLRRRSRARRGPAQGPPRAHQGKLPTSCRPA